MNKMLKSYKQLRKDLQKVILFVLENQPKFHIYLFVLCS